MNLNELMHDIHANAAAHGWWDTPRSAAEIRALIHSEWSESLEEDRAGRPGVWYACMDEYSMCHQGCTHYDEGPDCPDRASKPEGWAVELIDGVIRILDYLGWCGYKYAESMTIKSIAESASYVVKKWTLPEVVDRLHYYTAHSDKRRFEEASVHLNQAMRLAIAWIAQQGLNPEALLLEKHEYNKGRPYKHGKQY